jgi:hypothetical protein
MTSRNETVVISRWAITSRLFGNGASSNTGSVSDSSGPARWTMGILNDKETVEVPG